METNAEVANVKSRGVIYSTITKIKENEIKQMIIDTRDSELVSQKPYPITMKDWDLV